MTFDEFVDLLHILLTALVVILIVHLATKEKGEAGNVKRKEISVYLLAVAISLTIVVNLLK